MEALASHQHVVLHVIFLFIGWVDESCAELATDIDGFVGALRKVLAGKSQNKKQATKWLKAVAFDKVANELVDVYEK